MHKTHPIIAILIGLTTFSAVTPAQANDRAIRRLLLAHTASLGRGTHMQDLNHLMAYGFGYRLAAAIKTQDTSQLTEQTAPPVEEKIREILMGQLLAADKAERAAAERMDKGGVIAELIRVLRPRISANLSMVERVRDVTLAYTWSTEAAYSASYHASVYDPVVTEVTWKEGDAVAIATAEIDLGTVGIWKRRDYLVATYEVDVNTWLVKNLTSEKGK